MANRELEWTGERIVTSISSVGAIEHLHRYAIACEYVKDQIVLDIASGEGYGSNLLAKKAKKVIGIDLSEEVIAYSSNKYIYPNLIFKVGNVTNIPLDDAIADVVVSFETLEHIYEHEIMFKEIKRVMKPNGLLIISTPEKSNYEDVNKEKNHFHIKELYFEEFEQLIKHHFKNYCFLSQKTIYGTLIVPRQISVAKYSEYWGDFTFIKSTNKIKMPIFNICVASNKKIPQVDISFFDAKQYYDQEIFELQNQINRILKSHAFQVGKLILYPLRKIKKWISK